MNNSSGLEASGRVAGACLVRRGKPPGNPGEVNVDFGGGHRCCVAAALPGGQVRQLEKWFVSRVIRFGLV